MRSNSYALSTDYSYDDAQDSPQQQHEQLMNDEEKQEEIDRLLERRKGWSKK